jgi:hypothetical protein
MSKGRVKTILRMFMLDQGVVEDLVARYARGEIGTIECREGVTIKHPKDKYDKKIAKEEATKNLKKKRYAIIGITIVGDKTSMKLVTPDHVMLEVVKDQHGVRVYG